MIPWLTPELTASVELNFSIFCVITRHKLGWNWRFGIIYRFHLFWHLAHEMWPTDSPETSVLKLITPRNNPEDERIIFKSCLLLAILINKYSFFKPTEGKVSCIITRVQTHVYHWRWHILAETCRKSVCTVIYCYDIVHLVDLKNDCTLVF